jgi:hypothetical protein
VRRQPRTYVASPSTLHLGRTAMPLDRALRAAAEVKDAARRKY